MARPNVVKLVGVDSKNGEISAVYISHELSGYKGKFVPDRPHGEWETKTIINSRTGEKEIYSFCPCCGASYPREGEAE